MDICIAQNKKRHRPDYPRKQRFLASCQHLIGLCPKIKLGFEPKAVGVEALLLVHRFVSKASSGTRY